ncbi:hypothetical protein, partial [Azospirillum sp. TSA6c]|uniref:hypothetical protein n=1 Tax=Azospirillum sp. TSA6c TaxID=709813 RepID=UPI001B3BB3E4
MVCTMIFFSDFRKIASCRGNPKVVVRLGQSEGAAVAWTKRRLFVPEVLQIRLQFFFCRAFSEPLQPRAGLRSRQPKGPAVSY